MTLTVLASFSFLALVVTARPILDSPRDASLLASKPALQNAIQSYFHSRTGLLPPSDEDIQVHLTSPAEQESFLSQLGLDAVKVIAPIQDAEERKLYEAIGGKLDDLDGGVRVPEDLVSRVAAEEAPAKSPQIPQRALFDFTGVPLSEPPPLLLLTLSVASAALAFVGVSLALCFILPVREFVLGKRIALEEDGEKGPDDAQGGNKEVSLDDEKVVLDEKATLSEPVPPPPPAIDLDEKQDLISFDKLPAPSAPTPPPPSLPASRPITPQPSEKPLESHPDPDLLPLPTASALPSYRHLSTPPRSPARRPLQMRELPQAGGQPAWATLASAASSTSDLSIPGGLPLAMFEPTYHAPSADASLARSSAGRQVRMVERLVVPLADPAWVVQLMVQALWGWMAVFVGGAR